MNSFNISLLDVCRRRALRPAELSQAAALRAIVTCLSSWFCRQKSRGSRHTLPALDFSLSMHAGGGIQSRMWGRTTKCIFFVECINLTHTFCLPCCLVVRCNCNNPAAGVRCAPPS